MDKPHADRLRDRVLELRRRHAPQMAIPDGTRTRHRRRTRGMPTRMGPPPQRHRTSRIHPHRRLGRKPPHPPTTPRTIGPSSNRHHRHLRRPGNRRRQWSRTHRSRPQTHRNRLIGEKQRQPLGRSLGQIISILAARNVTKAARPFFSRTLVAHGEPEEGAALRLVDLSMEPAVLPLQGFGG